MSAVEQLENGVRIQCHDGALIACKPLTLKQAKRITALWDQRFAPRPPVSTPPTDAEQRALGEHTIGVANARIGLVKVFTELYPELEDHVSPGDVEWLLPDFFWSATGASVPAASASPPTGTPASASTSPSGASSPAST